MRIAVYASLESLLLICASILWCEFGYYYYIFHFGCNGWPQPEDATNQETFTRVMVLSDNHIMGSLRSMLFDKLRREWEMKQAFSFAISAFQPDVIIFLGDIFDEGSYSRDELFDKARDDFASIFPHNPNKHQRVIIAGNHDVGNHDQTISFPYLIHRFHDAYGSTPNVELLDSTKLSGLNIIAMNSMSFYNDSCPYCLRSIADVNRIARELDQRRAEFPQDYSAPILLTHIPLYRLDDTSCEHPYSLRNKVKHKNIEGKDVLHKSASKFLLSRLKPRLILSGHTHMDCTTTHKLSGDNNEVVDEITVSSFNHKYAEGKPSLLLLSLNKNYALMERCQLVDEWVIVLIYIATSVIVFCRSAIPSPFGGTNFRPKITRG